MPTNSPIHAALQDFAEAVTEKLSQITLGEPEEQLRTPFENFIAAAAAALDWNVVCTGETPLPDRIGRPDFAVHRNGLLAGYVELKPTGTGAVTSRFTGHNSEQFKRFSAIPNILYADGNEWALYRDGEIVGGAVRFSGDVSADGRKAVSPQDSQALESLLRDFFMWQPFIPTDSKGHIDLRRFAEMLAPLCRMLRDDVTNALERSDSPIVQLATDWRQLLFPDAPDEQFADAYAQTVLFALLLGRSEGADPLTLSSAEKALALEHNLLSRALHVLTDPSARDEIAASLDLLLRVVAVVPVGTLTSSEDPWLYFYEDFLAVYDPDLRKNAGAYYTPVEVVRAQVRLVDNLLVERLGKALGFVGPGVVTLDPAVGTGTYLLGVIEHALGRVEAEQGAGAVPGQATALAANLYGFELMAGPYAVSELRVSRALRDRGAQLPAKGTNIFLTDTLESPNAEPLQPPLILQPIAEQHVRALEVKSKVPVIVCLGNPPYDRHEAATVENTARTGGWVRHGEGAERPILRDFLDPVTSAGHGVHLKNLYNLYVYFWRWALWKVFEKSDVSGPGIVSFISGSSYLHGYAFCGMRERMRRLCDEIWILDLGGEGHGSQKDDNVFAIQTPVAIAVAFRSGSMKADTPARVSYARVEGSREDKLAKLDSIKSITGFSTVEWRECPDDWLSPFRPAGEGQFFFWPLLTELMPWQHSGVQLKRTWPIAPDIDMLERRWRALLHAENRAIEFRRTSDREVYRSYDVPLTDNNDPTPIANLQNNAHIPEVQRYAYRSFDHQHIIADGRLISRPRPNLWNAHSESQVYLSSSFGQPLKSGPALTSSAFIPDLHYFLGRGGKEILPLYRRSDASQANILPGLLESLEATYKCSVMPQDFLAYVYGILAHSAFTDLFAKELKSRELRVPITRDAELFDRVRAAGAHLLWLHTYGERFVPEGKPRGHVPSGQAKCIVAVPGDPDGYPETFAYNDKTRTLYVGGGEFAPVEPELYSFEVSGFKVVESWLKYRMKKGAGKKSSPLDDIRPTCWTSQFTTELLELVWVLEATLATYPEQEQLLKEVIAGECFHDDELPEVPPGMRKPPKAIKKGLFG
ncbi:MAG: N-6 DNA methylase [Caldilineaceae bacterium]|nr:N-6 DNA methylase [Caldilineaceae bacterium]